jgi:hypothetical protein
VAASARPTATFAIDDAAANDVMVFRLVRRSGLLYRIISSLAAVCFDWLLEVGEVGDATNTRRLGLGIKASNHDSHRRWRCRTNRLGAAAPMKWAASHFEAKLFDADELESIRLAGLADPVR